MMALLWIAIGLIVLVFGAELLVRGAAGLAARFGVPPLVIGLTVVAFGTSAPELAVSVGSSLDGQAELALGNVIGSNIFNVLFILGACALVAPLAVAEPLIRRDVPMMIIVSLLVLAMAADGQFGRLEGLLLLGGLVGFTVWQFRAGRQSGEATVEAPSGGRLWRDPLLVAVGLTLLVFGARLLLEGAVTLAQQLGVSELVIGLTIVAAGTSLPEVATSLLASVRGQRDIAVGNVIGSSIFNLLGVLGAAVIVAPEALAVSRQVLLFDLPVMLAVAVACLPVFFTGHRVSRWEGAVFLGFYLLYTSYIVLVALGRPPWPLLQASLIYFVVPLTLLTLGVGLARRLRDRP